jgi:hypothetical protein
MTIGDLLIGVVGAVIVMGGLCWLTMWYLGDEDDE